MFRLGDIIIDRIQYGLAEDFDGNLLYILTQNIVICNIKF